MTRLLDPSGQVEGKKSRNPRAGARDTAAKALGDSTRALRRASVPPLRVGAALDPSSFVMVYRKTLYDSPDVTMGYRGWGRVSNKSRQNEKACLSSWRGGGGLKMILLGSNLTTWRCDAAKSMSPGHPRSTRSANSHV